MKIQLYKDDKLVDISLLSPGDHDIEVIAHALSNICRFNGHCEHFYSVAEHCVLGTQWLMTHYPEPLIDNPLEFLLHDAAEIYIGDIPTPLKILCREIMDLEDRILQSIYQQFDVLTYQPSLIKTIDRRMLECEHRELFVDHKCWSTGLKPLDVDIKCWKPTDAENQFLELFHRLY